MARKDKGHFASKHPGASVKKEVAELLKKKKTDGALTCPLAHGGRGHRTSLPLDRPPWLL